MHQACQDADKKVYENIDPKSSGVYWLVNQFRRESADVVGDKLVKNDAGEMSMRKDSKQKAWLEHYQRLLNVEFDWDPDHLSEEGYLSDEGAKPRAYGIVVEVIRAAGDTGT